MREHRGVPRLLIVVATLVLGFGLSATAPAAVAAPTGKPGDVVRSTEITDRPEARMASAARVFDVTYLSADPRGRLVEVKGSVSLPKKAPGPGGWRIVAWNHSTMGLGDSCTITDSLGKDKRGSRDKWLGQWLREDYVIAATEYQGIGGPGVHAYLDGPVAGKNTLDMVRAARSVVKKYVGTDTSDAFVSFGGSQGGHASMWSNSLAKSYAPELKNAATIAHSVPAGLSDYFAAIRPGFPNVGAPDYVTYFSYVLAGLKVSRPDIDVDSYLTPLGRTVIQNAQRLCYAESGPATKGLTVGQLVSRPLADGPLLPALRQHTRLPTSGYGAPILLQQGYLDVVAFTPLTEQFVSRLRSNGVNVTYRTYPTQLHGLSTAQTLEAVKWANTRTTWPR